MGAQTVQIPIQAKIALWQPQTCTDNKCDFYQAAPLKPNTIYKDGGADRGVKRATARMQEVEQCKEQLSRRGVSPPQRKTIWL